MDRVKRLQQMYPELNIIGTMSKTHVWIFCPTHGKLKQGTQYMEKGNGCLQCKKDARKLSRENNKPKRSAERSKKTFLQNAIDVWGDKYDYSQYDLLNNVDRGSILKIICPKHGMFEMPKIKHVFPRYATGCLKCEDYKGTDANPFTKQKYNQAIKDIKSKYGRPLSELNKQERIVMGRIKSRAENNKTLEKRRLNFVAKGTEVHDGYYTYENSTDYSGRRSSVTITCPEHGDFLKNVRDHLRGSGCPKCNRSKMEVEAIKLFKELGVDFEEQKKYEDLKNGYSYYHYDFYLPDYNLLVEMDGIQHFKEVKAFKDTLKDIKRRDGIKNEYATKNGIHLIRIPFNARPSPKEALRKKLKPFIN